MTTVTKTSQRMHKVATGKHRGSWLENLPTCHVALENPVTDETGSFTLRTKDLPEIIDMLSQLLEIINDDDDT